MQVEKPLIVARRGLTLVELLVTISIMGLVVAISLPMVKPMLESNKTKSGADIVAGFLAQARDRAIEEGRPVGVTFERVLDYEDNGAYPYNGASILMRQVAEPKPLSGFVKDVRVAVDASGQITFWVWSATASPPQWINNTTEGNYWTKLVNPGDQIQFNAQGPKYDLSSVFQIDMAKSSARNLIPPVISDQQPAMFKVFRKPQPGKVAPTMAPPVALPEGIVVDLDSSGMGQVVYNEFDVEMDIGNSSARVVRDQFCANGQSDDQSVTIMFSPTGEVDKVYYSKQLKDSTKNTDIPTGPIFLNIGIWERAGFWVNGVVSNDHLPDIGTGKIKHVRNYYDMNNYWVTLFPRTGTIRINRVAAVPTGSEYNRNVYSVTASRKHAASLHGPEAQ